MTIQQSFPVEELRKKSIFLATPMYGGLCYGTYTKSILNLHKLCSRLGVEINTHFIFNESLITRARNYCADEFLRAKWKDKDGNEREYTHLLFIDSDISFDPRDALVLLGLDFDIGVAPYPKKCISWEKVLQAANHDDISKEVAEDPNLLQKYIGDYVFNCAQERIVLNEPAEVTEAGTGFMMIRKNVLEKFAEEYPELKYFPDHNRTEHFNGTRKITAFFDTVIDDVTERYLSEDYMFCRWASNIGFKIMMCPWMNLTHTGTFTFGGSLADLARAGSTPTGVGVPETEENKEVKAKIQKHLQSMKKKDADDNKEEEKEE